MSRHFGDMLLERRRQMGVSIQQVSNIVKIRPQIIEYFETENFAAMPPRGYAQGMISSYARYLGLNPHDVVDAYFDALHEYEHGSGRRVGRFQEAAADASPRSSNAPARYMMVNSVPPSRYGARPQQAGYVSESTSPHEPMASARLRPAQGGRGSSSRGYDPTLRSRTNGRDAAYDPARRGDPRTAPRPGRAQNRPAARDPRRADGGSAQRYGNGFDDRARRDAHGARSEHYGQGGARPLSGRGGARKAPTPPTDPRLLIAGGVIALLVLVLLAVFAMRGCAPAPTDRAGSSDASVSQVDKKANADPAEEDDEGEDAGEDSEAGEDGQDASAEADDEPEETIVKVSVKEKGAVAWVEVKLDGKIVLGKQVLGPFEQEFTVTSQIDITTDSPSDVTVRKNGEKVRYDTKVSGVGKVSIVAPKKDSSDEKVVDSDGDGTPDMTAAEAEAAGIDVPAGDAGNDTASNAA